MGVDRRRINVTIAYSNNTIAGYHAAKAHGEKIEAAINDAIIALGIDLLESAATSTYPIRYIEVDNCDDDD